MKIKPTSFDRFALAVSPSWGLSRIRSRAISEAITSKRHYEAAAIGRRTSGWMSNTQDANSSAMPAISKIRGLSRDLIRNNGWARSAIREITRNTIGWGIKSKPVGGGPSLSALWKRWSESTECDADGVSTFAGLQRLALATVATSGSVLVRRRNRLETDGFSVPLQVQILEPDFLDTTHDGVTERGKTIEGVEFDLLGRRVAYWIFDDHPGSSSLRSLKSKRIPASEIRHVFMRDRPGQSIGVPWLAAAIVGLEDFDQFEDASLVRQKIAACFAAFVKNIDGSDVSIGEQDEDDPLVESLEPGTLSYLKPGQEVQFTSPPATVDTEFSIRTLRKIAAAIGVTYEGLTGDYSQVNFSSARMARIAHWGNVHEWRWDMMIPQFCDPVWSWFCEAAVFSGRAESIVPAEWTPPPMPMIEPDREGLAINRLVRSGAMTFSEMIREQGNDPESHLKEYASDLKRLDELGIQLDSDVRKVSQAGLTQERVGAQKQNSEKIV
jgi:lambda family phage portal protein